MCEVFPDMYTGLYKHEYEVATSAGQYSKQRDGSAKAFSFKGSQCKRTLSKPRACWQTKNPANIFTCTFQQ